MQQFGLNVVHADAKTVAEWRQLAESIWPKLRGRVVPPDLFDEVKRLRDEYRKTHPVATAGSVAPVSLAPPPPRENPAPATPFQIFEDSFSIAALSLMTALPVIEMVARQFRWPGIPGSAVVVQQLTLWIGMLGGMLASRSGRLLGLSSSSFLPESWLAPAKIFWSAALAAVSTCLA